MTCNGLPKKEVTPFLQHEDAAFPYVTCNKQDGKTDTDKTIMIPLSESTKNELEKKKERRKIRLEKGWMKAGDIPGHIGTNYDDSKLLSFIGEASSTRPEKKAKKPRQNFSKNHKDGHNRNNITPISTEEHNQNGTDTSHGKSDPTEHIQGQEVHTNGDTELHHSEESVENGFIDEDFQQVQRRKKPKSTKANPSHSIPESKPRKLSSHDKNGHEKFVAQHINSFSEAASNKKHHVAQNIDLSLNSFPDLSQPNSRRSGEALSMSLPESSSATDDERDSVKSQPLPGSNQYSKSWAKVLTTSSNKNLHVTSHDQKYCTSAASNVNDLKANFVINGDTGAVRAQYANQSSPLDTSSQVNSLFNAGKVVSEVKPSPKAFHNDNAANLHIEFGTVTSSNDCISSTLLNILQHHVAAVQFTAANQAKSLPKKSNTLKLSSTPNMNSLSMSSNPVEFLDKKGYPPKNLNITFFYNENENKNSCSVDDSGIVSSPEYQQMGVTDGNISDVVSYEAQSGDNELQVIMPTLKLLLSEWEEVSRSIQSGSSQVLYLPASDGKKQSRGAFN